MRRYTEPLIAIFMTCNEVIALNYVLHDFLDFYRQPGRVTRNNRELVKLIEMVFQHIGESASQNTSSRWAEKSSQP
ncbi:hypothetical protein EPA93_04270 [Ktedonosporobacter rubrisoli]|uniref:Uncharacterized protein n=1 Tax=Ktedonosporobacter rubrisoli TaxID=2509675 RepID=A0A4V0YY76_KTERU|nr:hypothetical protein [Ktedonosporobacter rubrisoli]QBD75251.1 hypothetical protein EPA93_04270 [Ktedonosporobacter rubrisoli]